jgi:3-isopropylmalate/(R)-2-methylmalate dehydratase small subunit
VNAVRRVTGRALPLDRANVDTDQIIPAHWLKRVERTGYGAGLFEAWRRDPSFVMNDPRYAGASILIAGPNFGSGSSREHAVWALVEAGFRAVIAPRLADIFRANCLKSGLVPAEIEADAVTELLRLVERDPSAEITVDVERCTVEGPGVRASFALEGHVRTRLLEGLDDIAVTLAHVDEITKYESTRATWLPSLRD